MNEKNSSASPNPRTSARSATRVYASNEAPGAALRVPPEDAMSPDQRRYQTLERPTQLPGGEGLLPLNSRGLLAGGGFLALLGLKHWRSFIGLGIAGVGGGLLYSGLKNNGIFEDDFKRRALNTQLGKPQQRSASVVVERPVDTVFEAWSEFSNLALCMAVLDEVERIDDKHWYFKASPPRTKFFIEWRAEVVEMIDNEAIAWRTMPGSDINHEGLVEFHALPDGLSTEVRCKIVFLPPAGKLGQSLAKSMSKVGNRMLRKEMERFKYFMEPHPAPLITDDSTERPTSVLPTPAPDLHTRPDLRP